MVLRLWRRAAQILILIAITSIVVADSDGSYLWYPLFSNEANSYARLIELQHSGDYNGQLGSTGTRKDPQFGLGHPCVRFWQPFLFEFPRALGRYPEGTLVLVGVLVPFDSSYTSFFLWRSFDHGRTWIPGGEWQRGGTFLGGIWEPFLFLDNENKLVAIFSDERLKFNWSQALVRVTSNDGGDSWGHYHSVVTSYNHDDRPGMAVVARMDNGEYALAYEYCVTVNCQIYVKIISNESNWESGSFYMGDTIFTTDNLFPVGSPFLVWEPKTKQLVLSSSAVYRAEINSSLPEFHRVIFTNRQHGRGQWKWSPAPWNVRTGSSTCRSNYSPNLLARSNGKIRLTAPTSEGGCIKCSEKTGEAFVGVLPYRADFTVDGQLGWINFGGNWSISGDEYGFAPVADRAAIAVTGSTGWTEYTVTSDVMMTSHSGQVGVMIHVSASASTRFNSLQGFTFVISAGMNNSADKLIVVQEGTESRLLISEPTPWPVRMGSWYRLSLEFQSNGTLAIVAMEAYADKEETKMSPAFSKSIATRCGSDTDNDFGHGMAGLFGRDGGGKFRNVQITTNAVPINQAGNLQSDNGALSSVLS